MHIWMENMMESKASCRTSTLLVVLVLQALTSCFPSKYDFELPCLYIPWSELLLRLLCPRTSPITASGTGIIAFVSCLKVKNLLWIGKTSNKMKWVVHKLQCSHFSIFSARFSRLGLKIADLFLKIMLTAF